MEINDAINACFEAVGAVSSWLNVRAYLRDRDVKGVVWSMSFFWVLWGGWNLILYPSLDLYLSYYAGVVLFLGNLVWLSLVVYDIVNKKNKNDTSD